MFSRSSHVPNNHWVVMFSHFNISNITSTTFISLCLPFTLCHISYLYFFSQSPIASPTCLAVQASPIMSMSSHVWKPLFLYYHLPIPSSEACSSFSKTKMKLLSLKSTVSTFSHRFAGISSPPSSERWGSELASRDADSRLLLCSFFTFPLVIIFLSLCCYACLLPYLKQGFNFVCYYACFLCNG